MERVEVIVKTRDGAITRYVAEEPTGGSLDLTLPRMPDLHADTIIPPVAILPEDTTRLTIGIRANPRYGIRLLTVPARSRECTRPGCPAPEITGDIYEVRAHQLAHEMLDRIRA